jgi:hypothetical protein
MWYEADAQWCKATMRPSPGRQGRYTVFFAGGGPPAVAVTRLRPHVATIFKQVRRRPS